MTDEELRTLQAILEDREKKNETLHQQTVDQVNGWARTAESGIASQKETAIKNEDKPGVEKAEADLAQVEKTRASWLRFEDQRYGAEKSDIAADGKKVEEMKNRHELEKAELATRQAGEAAERTEALNRKAEERKQAEAERAKETEKAEVSDPAKKGIEIIATGVEMAHTAHAVYEAVTKGEMPDPAKLVEAKLASEGAKHLANSGVDKFREEQPEKAAWVVGSDPKKIDQEAREHTSIEARSEKNQVLREVHQEDVNAGKQAEDHKFKNAQQQEGQALNTQQGAETARMARMLRPPPPEPPPVPKKENKVEDSLHP